MKKRLLSFLLTGSLLLMLLPTAALAEDTAALSGGELLTKDNISTYVNKDLGGGSYVLSDDITVESGSLRFGGTASLDLSGHTLTFNAPAETSVSFGSAGSYYVLHAGIVVSGTMTLTDSSEDLRGTLDVRGTGNTGVLVTPGANFTMTGGTITNSTPDNNRGYGLAVFDATATMAGGKITGEKSCGVWTTDAATYNMPRSFTMSGSAVISDCGGGVDGAGYGGGVRIDAGTFTMEGGTITNCAANKGGGVYFCGDTFTMSGGSITNCKAGNGGGVDIKSSTFNLSGGTISGCESTRGGGVYLHNPECTFTMSSGSITGCSALAGGGVYMESDSASTFTMEGGSITNCMATGEGAGYGGGVLMSNGRFTMNDGEISGCTANEGSSICTYGSSTASDVTLNANTVARSIVLSYQLNGNTYRMEGLGTSAYPYQIENGTQLLLFQSIVNGTNGQTPNPAACAELTKDIDMRSIANFAPIGTETASYIGTFNGNGHNISGLSVSGSDYVGLFGYVNGATIQYINLCDSQITATNAGGIDTSTGGIVGFATGPTKIENCSTNNIKIDAANSRHIGGIIGRGEASTKISNCTNTSSFGGTYNVGGIAGSLDGSSITNCGNSGDLPAPWASGCVGGIVGFAQAGQISTCYNTGEITGRSNADVGGIVGMFKSSFSISDCYNVGDVQGGQLTGGIAGSAIGTFRYCYNTGAVTDSQCRGGVIGSNSGITIDHCYYLDTAAPVGISYNSQPGVESRTAAEFANGSVLTSLTEGRDDGQHPWNGSCQYLNATGKTQPVFQQQGDTHNHTSNTWLHDETNHWKVCDCNAVFDKAAHTAADDGNCTTPVLCEVCDVTVTAAKAAHTWGVWTTNSDGTHTRRCTTPGCTAGVETETCTDANHDYTCDLCGAALPRPAPTATPTAAPTATPTATPAPTATAAPTATPAPTATAAPGRRTESAAVTPTAAPTSTLPQPTPRPTATAQPVIPATGDTDPPVLWTVLLFISGAALLTLTANSKRRKR